MKPVGSLAYLALYFPDIHLFFRYLIFQLIQRLLEVFYRLFRYLLPFRLHHLRFILKFVPFPPRFPPGFFQFIIQFSGLFRFFAKLPPRLCGNIDTFKPSSHLLYPLFQVFELFEQPLQSFFFYLQSVFFLTNFFLYFIKSGFFALPVFLEAFYLFTEVIYLLAELVDISRQILLVFLLFFLDKFPVKVGFALLEERFQDRSVDRPGFRNFNFIKRIL